MKRTYVIVLLCLCAVSCAQFEVGMERSNDSIKPRERRTRLMELSSQYSLTTKDIDAYLHFKQLQCKEGQAFEVKSVIPFPDEINPALYIINYSDNWEMISSDKRTAPVLASSPGLFNLNDENDSFMAWLYALAEELDVLKMNNYKTIETESHLNYWHLINADREFIESKFARTRSDLDTSYHPWPGHYELERVEYNTITVDSIDHLTTTKWGQGEPYNQYCPYVSYVDTSRCKAGCVPVAGAQLIYYYHNYCNRTPALYDSAYCNMYRSDHPDWDDMMHWHKTPTAWNLFSTADSSRIAAILVSHLGKYMQVDYGSNLTFSHIMKLWSPLDGEYDLPTSYEDYDSDSILYLLRAGCPSISQAIRYDIINNIQVPRAHAFIIDKYKQAREVTRFYYVFIPKDDANGSDYSYEYEYQSPVATYFSMNWGWYGNKNDVLCIKDGDWYGVKPTPYVVSGRKMLIYCSEE